jgi:uncharacterized protein
MNKVIALTVCLLLVVTVVFAQVGKAPTPINLGITEEIASALLAEKRTLNIYLPEGYDPADTVRYPVIYLLDGGIDEDFIHVVGLVQFNTFPWVNRLPKTIVVGIANTDRERDMTFPSSITAEKKKFSTSGGSAKFVEFLEKELQPYIRNRYRTTGRGTLIGESLAGLFATEVLFTRPAMFDKYIIVSPSLWWDNGSLLKRKMAMTETRLKHRKEVYIGVGKEGLGPSPEPHVMEVDANLLAEKIEAAHNKKVSVYFDYLPEENHATVAHQAILNAFKMLSKAGEKK